MYVAGVVGDYPEELRPERVLNFTDVVAISADKDPRGIEKLKHRVREVLDFYAALRQEDLETKAVATLRAQMTPKGPQMLWMITLHNAIGEDWIKGIHEESNAYVKTYKDLSSFRLLGVDQCPVVLVCDMWRYTYDIIMPVCVSHHPANKLVWPYVIRGHPTCIITKSVIYGTTVAAVQH